jgi:carbamoyl-phosphate synthase large subunit
MIAGIGGASLGTEILKCLAATDGYEVYGCDISVYAFGHYQQGFSATFVVERERYIESVLELCSTLGIQVLIPGGEEPLVILGPATPQFQDAGICIASNSPQVIATCSDKGRSFERMQELGIPIPYTVEIEDVSQFDAIGYPCVVKPATGTGGSSFVFLTANPGEATQYGSYLLKNGKQVIAQEYISVEEGEFTVAVLSLPDGRVVGSVAMRRLFHTKLSVLAKTETGLVSTGYSQGLIDEFPEVQAQAERIAKELDSTGPLNIQGRVRDGVFVPFEINPRFSASTYLRAMAGFNEVDIYLRHVLFGEEPATPQIRPGYYLRSLAETYVGKEQVKQ